MSLFKILEYPNTCNVLFTYIFQFEDKPKKNINHKQKRILLHKNVKYMYISKQI